VATGIKKSDAPENIGNSACFDSYCFVIIVVSMQLVELLTEVMVNVLPVRTTVPV